MKADQGVSSKSENGSSERSPPALCAEGKEGQGRPEGVRTARVAARVRPRPHGLLKEWTWSGPAHSQGSPELRKPLCSLIWTHTPWPSPALGPPPKWFGQLLPVCLLTPSSRAAPRGPGGSSRGCVSIVAGDEAGGSGRPLTGQSPLPSPASLSHPLWPLLQRR